MYNAVDKLALFLPLGLPHRKSTFFTIFTPHISNIFNSIEAVPKALKSQFSEANHFYAQN